MKTTLPLLAALSFSCALPLSAADPAVPRFKAVDIDTKIEIGYGVTVADVDGDKKPDILLVDKNQVVWYQNPTWKKHVIAENLTKLDHVCIAAQDIDGDGKCEIAIGAGWNPGDTVNSGAVFYLIPPDDRTQKWEPVELPHEPTVHRMRWLRDPISSSYYLVVAPLHGRGNKNGAGAGVKIIAYKNTGAKREPWKLETLNESMHMTHNIEPLLDSAGNTRELLIAGKEGVFSLHLDDTKNLAQHAGTESGGAGEVRIGKLPGEKWFFATVEPMHGTNLVVYTLPPRHATAVDEEKGKFLWDRHVLDSSLVDGHALACGDLAGLGRDQIVVGWRAMGKKDVKVGIKLFTPLDAAGKDWKQTLIDDNTMACEDLCLADLNGDGKLDIIAAGRATKNVKVYFNEGVE
jgi:hypothetical protein